MFSLSIFIMFVLCTRYYKMMDVGNPIAYWILLFSMELDTKTKVKEEDHKMEQPLSIEC